MDKLSLKRRGFNLGMASIKRDGGDELSNWRSGKPVFLAKACSSELIKHADSIAQSKLLYQAVLAGQQCDPILAEKPYCDRLDIQFESLGSSINEGDKQEIETVLFDAVEGDTVLAEDLWMKVSWLSFYEQDNPLRFRFSFGIDFEEDVAADLQRQNLAAELTDAVFPESSIVIKNNKLIDEIKVILDCEMISFVERIIYFNSPEGGAYLHHDRERGHAGVVYAQLSGATFWLALPKLQLLQEIESFVAACVSSKQWPEILDNAMQNELKQLVANQNQLSAELDSFCNDTLILLINETHMFIQQLIGNGHGQTVQAGDVLLLPQESDLTCCWHSVFCLGDEAGQALSFAIRRV